MVHGYAAPWALFTGMGTTEASFWNGYYRTCSSKYHHVNPDLSSSLPGGTTNAFHPAGIWEDSLGTGVEKESAEDAGATGAGAKTGSSLFTPAPGSLFSHCLFCCVPGMANSDWTDSVA